MLVINALSASDYVLIYCFSTVVTIDSNLQREQVLPSEKAFAYKMKLDAMKRQGQRTDLISPPLVEKLSGKAALSTAQIGKSAGESHEQVRRFIRLTNLILEILDMVDNSVLKEKDKLQMALRPAVELSYLTEDEQKDLLETMAVEDCTPSHAQAVKMRDFSEKGKLNADVILSIIQEEKPTKWSNSKCPRAASPSFSLRGRPHRRSRTPS